MSSHAGHAGLDDGSAPTSFFTSSGTRLKRVKNKLSEMRRFHRHWRTSEAATQNNDGIVDVVSEDRTSAPTGTDFGHDVLSDDASGKPDKTEAPKQPGWAFHLSLSTVSLDADGDASVQER